MQHVEAGFVSGKPGSPLLHSAKGADRNMAVWFAAPRATPPFQLQQLLRGFLNECFNRILIA